MHSMFSTRPDLDTVASSVRAADFQSLLERLGFRRHGSRWHRVGDEGHIKLVHYRKRPGRIVAFLNDELGHGAPFDAPALVRRLLGLSWDDAGRFVIEHIRQQAWSGQTGGGEVPRLALPRPRSGPEPSVEIVQLAVRMSRNGVAIDRFTFCEARAASARQSEAGDLKAKHTFQLLDRIEACIGRDGRARPGITPSAYVTGRWAMAPPIQDLPRECRGIVASAPGHLLLHADLRSSELVAAALLAPSPDLLALAGRDDPYFHLAGKLLDRSPTDRDREVVKTLFLLWVGGAGQPELANVLNDLPHAESVEVRVRIQRLLPGIRAWKRGLEPLLREGRPLQLPSGVFLHPEARHVGQLASIQAQGLVTEHVDHGLLGIERACLQNGIAAMAVLHLGDALLFEVAAAQLLPAVAIVKEELERPWFVAERPVSFRTRISAGQTWSRLVEVQQ